MKKHIKKMAIRWYTIIAVLLIGLTLPAILGGCDFINKVVGNVYRKADEHRKRGDVYLDQGQYAKAIAEYTMAIELSTDNNSKAYAYYLRGMVYKTYLRQYANGIADYDEAMRLTTDNSLRTRIQRIKEKMRADEHSKKGRAYNRQGEYAKAIEEYTKAIELDTDNSMLSVLYRWRGDVYKKQKQYSKAIAEYTKAIELDADDIALYHLRGGVYGKQKQYGKSIADYTKAIELYTYYHGTPKASSRFKADAYYNRGKAYYKDTKYGKAIADYTKAIELYTHNSFKADAYYNRGEAYYQDKSFKADAYYNRGEAYYQDKRYGKAIADYTKVIELTKEPLFNSDHQLRIAAQRAKAEAERAKASTK